MFFGAAPWWTGVLYLLMDSHTHLIRGWASAGNSPPRFSAESKTTRRNCPTKPHGKHCKPPIDKPLCSYNLANLQLVHTKASTREKSWTFSILQSRPNRFFPETTTQLPHPFSKASPGHPTLIGLTEPAGWSPGRTAVPLAAPPSTVSGARPTGLLGRTL